MFFLFFALNLLFAEPSSYTLENWYFEKHFSYGDNENGLLHTGSQVIMVGKNYYILDSALSTVIELFPDGSWCEHLVEGEGPGECRQPNSLNHSPNGFVLLKTIIPTIIHTDLTKKTEPKRRIVIEKTIFARNLIVHANGYFIANIIGIKENNYYYALSIINELGQKEYDFLKISRHQDNDFPIWFYRNSWAVNEERLAVITDYDYSVTVFNLNGEIKAKIEGPTGQKGHLGANLQGVFYAGDTLLVLPFSSGDTLDFHAPEEKKIIRINGVRASDQAQYFWLNRDTLAVMYGWASRVFHTSDEEHFVTFFRRKKS